MTISVLNKRQIRLGWIAMALVILAVPFTPVTQIGWLIPVFYVIMAAISIYLIWNWMGLEIDGTEQWGADHGD